MLGAEIRKAPRPGPHHTEIAALGERRAVGEHQLCMVSRGPGRIRRTEPNGWPGAATGINSTPPILTRSGPGTLPWRGSRMPIWANTGMYELGHRAESFDMQPQGNGRFHETAFSQRSATYAAYGVAD